VVQDIISYSIRNEDYKDALPKLKPCLAIKALLTMMIPTDVTTLNIHAPASSADFLSTLLPDAILSEHVASTPIF
jgi:hypothetical protein